MYKLNNKLIFILYLVVCITVILHSSSMAQSEILRGLEVSLQSEGDLHFNADLYQFEADDNRLRIEICYSLDLFQLQIDSQPRSEYTFTLLLKLLNKEGKLVKDITAKKMITEETLQSSVSQSFLDLQKIYIVPDTLNLVMTIVDSISGKSGFINKTIDFQPFSSNLSLSDPVFVAYVGKASGEKNIFTRQNILMIPNPSRLFNASDNTHFYLYFEINNLTYDLDRPSLYNLECTIEDLKGNEIFKIDHSQLKKVGINTSRIEKINFGGMSSGMYALKIHIVDLENDQEASKKRYFKIFSEDNGSQLVMPMEEEDIEKYKNQIKYIATDREMDIFERLDNIGKQEFLLRFWKSKDPTPETPENEFMLQHFQRIEFCEKNFNKGINSDQGRVYIQYGPPLDIERSVSTLEYSKPIEIWTYSIDGRVEFVFVDRTNDNNFMLMHSTHPDEYYNPDWMQEF